MGLSGTLLLLIGVLIGLLVAAKESRYLLTLYYHYSFWAKKNYLAVYDALEGRDIFDLMPSGGGMPKTYKAYLIMRERNRSSVEARFRTLWKGTLLHVLKAYGAVFVVGIVILRLYFVVFLGGFLVAHIGVLVYVLVHKKRRTDFFGLLVYRTIIADIAAEKPNMA